MRSARALSPWHLKQALKALSTRAPPALVVPTFSQFSVSPPVRCEISGEALLGVFQDEEKRDAVIFANHNCYQEQGMKVRVESGVKRLELLDRRTGAWGGLALEGGEASFALPPGAAAVVRVGR